MTELSLSELFSGTFIEDIIDPDLNLNLDNKNTSQPIRPGERVIGGLTELESRLKAAALRLDSNARAKANEAKRFEAQGQTELAETEVDLALALRERADCLRAIMWCSIRERIAHGPEIDTIGIRESNKVVEAEPSTPPEMKHIARSFAIAAMSG
jgi:hypothetical protein